MGLGFTSAGFLRKRFVEFYEDYKNKIQSNDAFKTDEIKGTTTQANTVLNNPDKYAGTPLVELVTMLSGSDHDIHEAVEAFAQQLDPRDAEGAWLDSAVVLAGLRRKEHENDLILRKRLLLSSSAFARSQTGKGTLAGVLDLSNVEWARLTESTLDRPAKGLHPPSAMLSVLGDVSSNEVAQAVWDTAQIGAMNWVGDNAGQAFDINNNCHEIRYQAGCRVYIGACICATLDNCSDLTLESIPSILVDNFRAKHFGDQIITPGMVRSLLCDLPGITIHSIELARRGKQLKSINNEGELCGGTEVYVGNSTDPELWATNSACGKCAGEIWSECENCTIELMPWEFADMTEPFITIIDSDCQQC